MRLGKDGGRSRDYPHKQTRRCQRKPTVSAWGDTLKPGKPGRYEEVITRDIKNDAVSSDGSPKGTCLFTSAAGNTPERERE